MLAVRCWGRAWKGVSLSMTLLSKRRDITLTDIVDTLREYHSWDECVELCEIEERKKEYIQLINMGRI